MHPVACITAASTPAVTISLPANISLPTIDNFGPNLGDTLTASPGIWSGDPASYSYQWLHNGSAIEGATANTYTTQPDDVSNAINVEVTATNVLGSGTATSGATDPVTNYPPTNFAAPIITSSADLNNPRPGDTLTVTDNGSWSFAGPDFTYTWCYVSSQESISGSDGTPAYTIQDPDTGNAIYCQVTATNEGGSTSVNSNTTGAVLGLAPVNSIPPGLTSSGDINNPFVGDTLTSDNGSWGHLPTGYSYAWMSVAGEVSGMGSSYTIHTSDIAGGVYCIVTASNAWGGNSAASGTTGTVQPAPVPAETVAPNLASSGDLNNPNVGDNLTTDTGSWTNSPTSYSYQWMSNSGAVGFNESGYTIQSGDAGGSVYCVVTASNSYGSGTASSNSTGIVNSGGAGSSPQNTGAPNLTSSGDINNPIVGDNLTTDNGSWNNSPTSYDYAWFSIAGAVGFDQGTYTIQSGDAGGGISCTVTATNIYGNSSASSNSTGTVQPGGP